MVCRAPARETDVTGKDRWLGIAKIVQKCKRSNELCSFHVLLWLDFVRRPTITVKVRLGPSGIHLFDRNSGLNLLVDEIAPSRESWATAPRHVSIGLTNACDLTCSYCFAPKHAAKLDFERLTGWMNELDGNSCLGDRKSVV